MTIYGVVKDNSNLTGIPNVTVTAVSAVGGIQNAIAAGPNGAFVLDGLNGTERISFSSIGYGVSSLPCSYFEGKGQVTVYLFPVATELPGVVVTPNQGAGSGWWWLVAGVIAAKLAKIF